MLRRTAMNLPLVALAVTLGTGFAQDQEAARSLEASKPLKFYRLDFVVKEVEGGKVLNARSYSMVAGDTKDSGSIRTGNRIPLLLQSGGPGPTSQQYIDTGVNIDYHSVKPTERDLSLFVSVEITSVPTSLDASAMTVNPVIRTNRWRSLAIVPLKKPTVIFSSDDPGSKRQMQMELTATPIN